MPARWLAILPMLWFVGCGASTPAAPTRPETEAAPTRYEVYQALLAHAAEPLSRGEYCDGVVPNESAPTLGDWLAYNLSLLESDDALLTIACEPAGEAWQCDAYFAFGAGTESPWNWGVRVWLDRRTPRAFAQPFMCIGAG